MKIGSGFARDWTISKTSRFFGKNRIAGPLLGRIAADADPLVREAVARHAAELGRADGSGLKERIPDDDPLTLIEGFLLAAGLPYERIGDGEIRIRKDFSRIDDTNLVVGDIALPYLRGLLESALPDWHLHETELDFRCRVKK
ncbi:MAG: hypothetical protein D5R99_00415 [Methanocalculus sp. MSAO_Arc1]|uniref:hypothetical protein n=1 Tax=Methanocalculus TaxID=71151 RepID=UPI000FF34686|nr:MULTISPECIES: hypothetical protein [unclassified Methanocalculus]MCP1661839.1 hypothetical protein [Methanocalculus sp. AMF5]RQD81972.1 MAG: hypothetical protein D5R99_00415 [Methanocalculus sp. MSAO_Arc1]